MGGYELGIGADASIVAWDNLLIAGGCSGWPGAITSNCQNRRSKPFMPDDYGLIMPRCGRLDHPEHCTIAGIRNADVLKNPWDGTD